MKEEFRLLDAFYILSKFDHGLWLQGQTFVCNLIYIWPTHHMQSLYLIWLTSIKFSLWVIRQIFNVFYLDLRLLGHSCYLELFYNLHIMENHCALCIPVRMWSSNQFFTSLGGHVKKFGLYLAIQTHYLYSAYPSGDMWAFLAKHSQNVKRIFCARWKNG